MKIQTFIALLLMSLPCAAKLAADRWGRATEEERHQLTRAEKYMDQREFKSAIGEYELFLQLYPKSEIGSYAQLMFAECTRQLGQINTAINEFRNVIDYFPDTIDAGMAQYSIAVCLTQSGDAEKAVKEFEKVVDKWPKEEFGGFARSEACTIYWRLGKLDKWAPHMDYLATGEYKDTTNLHHQSQRRLFVHRLSDKKFPEALELAPGTKNRDPLVSFADWTSDALIPQSLLAIYGDKVKKILPAIATDAVAFIEKQSAGMKDPTQKPALAPLCARIYARGGVADKAKERYLALIKEFPENDTFRMEYAGELRGAGNRAEARLVYHELKNKYTGDTEIAETYGEENNTKSCVEAYQTMLGKYPDKSNQIQWRLGEIHQRSGKQQEAIAAYQQSQREPVSLFRISECQGSLKQHDVAIQTLISVVNFFKPSAAEAQYRIAGHQAAKGDKEAAINTLKMVCRVYRNTSWAGKAHQDLTHIYGIDVTTGGASKDSDKPEK